MPSPFSPVAHSGRGELQEPLQPGPTLVLPAQMGHRQEHPKAPLVTLLHCLGPHPCISRFASVFSLSWKESVHSPIPSGRSPEAPRVCSTTRTSAPRPASPRTDLPSCYGGIFFSGFFLYPVSHLPSCWAWRRVGGWNPDLASGDRILKSKVSCLSSGQWWETHEPFGACPLAWKGTR